MRFLLTSLLVLPIISSTSFGQTLNDILQGIVEVNPATALANPLWQKMAPQNGVPDEVLVWKLNAIDHNDPDCYNGDFPATRREDAGAELYAYYPQGRDTLELIIFEEGTYMIQCLNKNGSSAGEPTIIMMNENFVNDGINTGYYEQLGGLTNSIKPLRVGRDKPAFVCFN